MSVLRRWLSGVGLALLVVLAGYLTAGRLLMPWVADYQDEVQARLGEALGEPVRLGALEGHWSGWAPLFDVEYLEVGRPPQALHVERVRLAPDLWGSLWHRQLRLKTVTVEGLRLVAEQTAEGRWRVRGLPERAPDAAANGPQAFLDALPRLGHVTLLDGQLSVLPRQGSPFTLNYLEAELTPRMGERYRLAARATLPDGERLATLLDGQPNTTDWRQGSLQGYLHLPQSDWARWLPADLTGAWRLREARAGADLWLDWSAGQLREAHAQLAAPALAVAHGDHPAVALHDVALNLALQGSAQQRRLALQLDSRPGEQPFALRGELTQERAESLWRLRLEQLDLAQVARLAQGLAPLPDAVGKALQALAPQGRLRNLNATYRPDRPLAERLTYALNLERVAFNAYHGAPAAAGITGSASGTLGGGELRLNTTDFMLHLSDLFPQPWRYDTARARLTWSLDEHRFTLGSALMQVSGAEGQASGDMHIQLGRSADVDSYMDLRVGLVNGDASQAGKYLPTRLPANDFSPELAHWLATAIVAGRIDQGIYQYRGSLRHGAPAHSRTMSLFFRVHDAQLAYQPGWPALREARGDVLIENDGVRVDVPEGRILNTRVRAAQARIPLPHDGSVPHLHLTARLDSDVRDGLKILQETPLPTAKAFAGWKGEGALTDSGLELDIPLAKGQDAEVVVDLAPRGARLELPQPRLVVSDIHGAFRYDTRSGLSASAITARAFDQPLKGQALAEGKPGHPRTRLLLDGRVDVAQLARWLEGGAERPLPVRGLLPYRLGLTLAERNELAVSSDLRGVTVDLPEPFGKAADVPREAFFSIGLDSGERRIEATYQDVADAVLQVDPSALAAGRGELRLGGQRVSLPATPGYRVQGRLSHFDLDGWQQAYQRYLPATSSSTAVSPGSDSLGLANLGPSEITFEHFQGLGQTLDNLRLNYAPEPTAWRIGVASQAVTGQIRVPRQGGQPIAITLQHLRIPQSPADPSAPDNGTQDDPLADFDPRRLPALDVDIQRLELGGRLVGAQRLQIRPTPRGANFNALDLDLRGLKVQGALRWEGQGKAGHSYFQGQLSGGNVADVLLGWNFASSITSRLFRLNAQIDWPGSPTNIALARLDGSLDARFTDGQLQQVEGTASALRIFGLLNFESIRRRLRLDFSDLFGQGLSYDTITGVLDARNGAFCTRAPITLSGPGAEMSLRGLLDLASSRVDADLKVGLPISNSLPLAALIAGAPAIGGALFIVDRLIGDRITRMASIDYHIEGPYQNPQITTGKRR